LKRKYVEILLPVFFEQIGGCFRHLNERLPVEDQKPGGYFAVFFDQPDGLPLLVVKVGEQDPQKAPDSLRRCLEKGKRLQDCPEHQSSWQSRNPDADEWGGAVRYGDFILSFSGLPELADEELMLWMLNPRRLPEGRMDRGSVPTDADLHQIARHSSNPYHTFPE
jgi:hypothetical protein